MFSGLSVRDELVLKMSLPRKSSGFGRAAVVYLVVLPCVPAPVLSVLFFKLREVGMEGTCSGFCLKSHHIFE